MCLDKNQTNQDKGINLTKDHLLGEGKLFDWNKQIQYEDGTIAQCHLVSLRAWKRVEGQGKKTTSFTKITILVRLILTFCKK